MMLRKLCLSVLLASPCVQGQGAFVMVSAASGAAVVAPDSLVSGFGTNLASSVMQASTVPFPATLNGDILQVSDSAGVTRPAPVIFVSPSQINFLMPPGMASGVATATVVRDGNAIARGTVPVQAAAPGVFTANQMGTGAAAALAVRVLGGPNGPRATFPTFQCDSPQQCKPVLLDPGIDTPTTLEFFGTGIRGGKTVTAAIGGQPVPVDFAGAQSQYPGLDQVNLPLLLNLRGVGLANVVITVDGQASNPVQVFIQ